MPKAPDYSTPNKKKRFVETECRKMMDAAEHVNGEADTYLDGAYGTRRQKAILNYLDKAEEDFKTFGLFSIVEDFAHEELMPLSNYNHLDSNCDIRIGAALWFLEQLRASAKLVEAYSLLPDMSGDVDAWYLPTDFYHPCYANDLIQSVIHLMTHRYDVQNRKRRHGIVITEENASGKEPGEVYKQLLKLLPEESVNRACSEFKKKVWELATRRMKGRGYFERKIRQYAQQVKHGAMGGPLAAPPVGVPSMNPMAGGFSGFGGFGNAGDAVADAAAKGRELMEKEHEFSLNFDALLDLDRRAVIKETGSREVAEALEGFTVEEPYSLCFALFYLIDTGDDTPWLMRSGSSLMLYCLRMLPWHMEQDDWDDDAWDDWYDGLSYNVNGWTEKEPVADQNDFYHDKHNGKNMAQIIYDLCRGVVPTGLHPFEEDRKRLVSEGMDEEKAGKITEMADFLFLMNFQARQIVNSDFPWLVDEEDEMIEEAEAEAENTTAQTDTPKQVKIGGYWGRVMGMNTDDDGNDASDAAETITTVHSAENEKLREELASLKKQLKSLKNALTVTRQESNNERAKYEHELKALRMEHRELADLRELVFNSGLSEEERTRREAVKKVIEYPYEVKKRTVIFGGHETWLKAIRPMLPGVKFVDLGNYAFHPDIVRNADVVWVQNNCISHTQYGNIVKMTRQLGIQLRYFGYASAEKCAEQLVVEDKKG